MEKEFLERLSAIETKLDTYIELHKDIVDELKNKVLSLENTSVQTRIDLGKAQTEIKWYAKIPVVVMVGLNLLLSIIALLKGV